ncbi:MAG: response regulator [Bacteriovoracaceae bacterium]
MLLVDDESEILEVLEFEIQTLNCKILKANNGREALDLIEKNRVDVIISDIKMPGIDGLELLTILKEKGVKTPVIIMTGMADNEKNLQAWILGAFDFILKPIDFEKLKNSINIAFTIGASYENPKNVLNKRKMHVPFTLYFDRDFIEKIQNHCYNKNISVSSFIYNKFSDHL